MEYIDIVFFTSTANTSSTILSIHITKTGQNGGWSRVCFFGLPPCLGLSCRRYYCSLSQLSHLSLSISSLHTCTIYNFKLSYTCLKFVFPDLDTSPPQASEGQPPSSDDKTSTSSPEESLSLEASFTSGLQPTSEPLSTANVLYSKAQAAFDDGSFDEHDDFIVKVVTYTKSHTNLNALNGLNATSIPLLPPQTLSFFPHIFLYFLDLLTLITSLISYNHNCVSNRQRPRITLQRRIRLPSCIYLETHPLWM